MARDVSGKWNAHQSNGFSVAFNLKQNGESLEGLASTAGLNGKGLGRVTNDAFLFTVDWTPGDSRGEYSGTFNLEGRITGITVDLHHPSSFAGWFSEKTF
jgi:hypothetical protein